jgi:hypothetical protein
MERSLYPWDFPSCISSASCPLETTSAKRWYSAKIFECAIPDTGRTDHEDMLLKKPLGNFTGVKAFPRHSPSARNPPPAAPAPPRSFPALVPPGRRRMCTLVYVSSEQEILAFPRPFDNYPQSAQGPWDSPQNSSRSSKPACPSYSSPPSPPWGSAAHSDGLIRRVPCSRGYPRHQWLFGQSNSALRQVCV